MTFELDDRPAASQADAASSEPDATPVRKHPVLASREIAAGDLCATAALLCEGFPDKPLAWFTSALAAMARMPAVDGMPRYGYLLEANGQPVGAVLTLVTQLGRDGPPGTRLNVACWYVRPGYRAYGTVLYQRVLSLRGVTCLNVTPAEHTWPVIEAQGFRRFAEGSFAGLPLLGNPALGTKVAPAGVGQDSDLTAYEHQLLAFHADKGCLAFTCASRTDTAPFVFRRRPSRRLLPAAQLIYCRDMADLGRYAGAIGRHLAGHGLAWMIAGANGPIAGMPGRYLPGKYPMYYRGSAKPRLGDIAYTEVALLAP